MDGIVDIHTAFLYHTTLMIPWLNNFFVKYLIIAAIILPRVYNIAFTLCHLSFHTHSGHISL